MLLEHPHMIWGFAALLPLIGLWIYMRLWQRSVGRKVANKEVTKRLWPEASKFRSNFKWTLSLLALAFLLLALANPQQGAQEEEVKRKGIDLMIALDLSKSMLAEDVAPNRLESAKRAISQLIDRLKSDRLGIVVFGGQAYVQLPITTDYAAAKLYLNTLNTNIVPTQGTAIGDAIDLSLSSFDFEKPTSKAILVITDGENHEGDALVAAKKAAEKGVVIHTVGMGSVQGSPIPIYTGRKQLVGHVKDREGTTVISRLNENMLIDIAGATDGTYTRAGNDRKWLGQLLEEIGKLQKTLIQSKVFTDYDDYFQYFLIPALLLLLLEFILPNKRSRWLQKAKANLQAERQESAPRKNVALSTWLLLFTLLASAQLASAQIEKKHIEDGNESYDRGMYEEAEAAYQKALKEQPGSFKAGFNKADALYKQEQYENALNQFQQLTHKATSKGERAAIYHNLGNSHMKLLEKQQGTPGGPSTMQGGLPGMPGLHGMGSAPEQSGTPQAASTNHLGEAINAYKEALRNNSTDEETRNNLAYALQLQQQQQSQQQQQNKDNQDQDQQQQQNKDQQQDQNKQNQDQQQQQNQEQQANKDQQQSQQQNQEQGNEQKREEQQGQPGNAQGISQEEAARLLNALNQEEQQLQNKLRLQTRKGQRIKTEKEW